MSATHPGRDGLLHTRTTAMVKLDVEWRCQGCQGPPGDVAPCPYAEELYGDEKPCNCCDECRRACAEEA